MDVPRPTTETQVEDDTQDYVEFLPLIEDEDRIDRIFAEFFLAILEARNHPALKVFGGS